ncbi:MAG TPA: hypothetical protein ENJ25_01570 [Firmicutes bacterium]|uniref:Uncharacterized protein n=1 Tax=candidate division TA06 bacterium TaxID=2250710 RepID=A0A660S7M8_UNCT6|nr:MAG: hypothetical protein DRP44_04760 [candidate division TA06 bacterium]HFD04816.1 hypothetical protein [Bacillota bacterium]
MENDELVRKFHKKFAIDLFNYVWSLMDKEIRSKEEDLEMIHAAHASRYHWGRIGSPIEIIRGEWQISRVYSVLKMGESALFHASQSLTLCQKNRIGDFDIAFAYEALARAYSVLGKEDEKNKYISLARSAGDKILDEENKKYFFEELKTI